MVLQSDALLAQARGATGLQDFGADWFLAPLQKLIECINAEAGLISAEASPVQRIVQALADRLQMVDLLRRHPEIRDEKVEVAAAILGLPRTGSTMLQRMLAGTTQLTSGYWWEVSFPLPLPGEIPGDPSPRQALAVATVEALYAAWPEFRSIHPMDAMAYDEDVILLDKTFLSSTYDSMLNIPSYGDWMPQQDHRRAYQELYLWLQILQHQSPWRRGRKWILKSPHHLLGGLQGFLSVFPDACAIMTHRPIEDVVPSYCSLCASITQPSSSTFDPLKQGEYWSRRFERAIHSLIDARTREPASRFIDVRYAELLQNPIAVCTDVMQRLNIQAKPDDIHAIQKWLDANQRDARPTHRYTAESYGTTWQDLIQRFQFYSRIFLTIPGALPLDPVVRSTLARDGVRHPRPSS